MKLPFLLLLAICLEHNEAYITSAPDVCTKPHLPKQMWTDMEDRMDEEGRKVWR